MTLWLQDNLFHIIKTMLGLGTSIFDVGSDVYMGATYLSCDNNSFLQMDLGTTTSPVNISFCSEPGVIWGGITLGLIQLPGFAFFGTWSLEALFYKEYCPACIFLALCLVPYPLLLFGFQLYFLFYPNSCLLYTSPSPRDS